MAMTVQITCGELLSDLIDAFARSGCVANRTAATSCQIVHPLASDQREAWLEVAFFLRAWQLRHPGVGAELTR
jgi:hypothetical protein